ncbi:RNA-splicing ligase RtcB [Metalysinibacillus saudimassiliensis]|uniref:3'-phosphate/5'-hydroxy nucleic acid ligase n=1 Tax=Metalysinibacillus saudimassiliensis TaxID=1461583 RepID=A0A078ME80_9BACL|nr:RNA-splicing ligase RtcB [Metalysinibacillus saudimassiliensis]
MKTTIFGQHEEGTLRQFDNCLATGQVGGGVLCADGHYGYSQPVGGVIAYKEQVAPSGVGYDIACGNKAVRTNLVYDDIREDMKVIMDDVAKRISFGVGRKNKKKIDHEVFDDGRWDVYRTFGQQEHDILKKLAYEQLGTVGAGNHFVDIFVEEATSEVWVANHFGSRGFGHKTASGFLNLAAGRNFLDRALGETMEQLPTLLSTTTELGQLYLEAMSLAGRYAYAGRDVVMDEVLAILGAREVEAVHNHHNFAWQEQHDGEDFIVVRKGATPSAPNQLGFIGGSMCDTSVIVRGKDNAANADAWYSTVHGAGRVMSRTEAAGKMNWKTKKRRGGKITPHQMQEAVQAYGIELRGAGTDESPFVYRKLQTVLDAHADTIEVVHKLRPIGVAMAGANEFDPYKD